MRRSASEIISELESRIARLEKQAVSNYLSDFTLEVNTTWSFVVPGRGSMGGKHKYYDGKVKSWGHLTKSLKEILTYTREFQAENERRPESDYSYPSGREFAKDQKGYSWSVIFLYKNNRNLSDTKVVVELKYKGKTFKSDDNFRIWSDYVDAVEAALNDRSFS